MSQHRIWTATMVVIGVIGIIVTAWGVSASAPVRTAVTCTFDGGGTITAGTYATTAEGTTWACNPAGTLTRITLAPPAAPAGTMPASAYVR